MHPFEVTGNEDDDGDVRGGQTVDRVDIVESDEAYLDGEEHDARHPSVSKYAIESSDDYCSGTISWIVGCIWLCVCFFLAVFFMMLLLLVQGSSSHFTRGTVPLWSSRKPILRFHKEPRTGKPDARPPTEASSSWTFQIMQITDIHLGEAEDTDWGPQQDEKTFNLLAKMLDEYETPDLLVLGGDQLTANNCLYNCTEYYKMLGDFLSQYSIPWATIVGNHDDLDFEVPDRDGVNGKDTIPHTYTRQELLMVDQSFPLSLSRVGPADVTGVSNYVLHVLMDDPLLPSSQLAVEIYFLDSGGGSIPEAIDDSQVKWLQDQATMEDVPAIAFQHIPTKAHEYDGDTCMGYQGENIEEIHYDGGIVDVMVESGRFHFLAVGHNHGNDYCCPYRRGGNGDNYNDPLPPDLYFCFGRHSGYGGYGTWQRGVRMYELLITDEDGDSSNRKFNWRTWVCRSCCSSRMNCSNFYFLLTTLCTFLHHSGSIGIGCLR